MRLVVESTFNQQGANFWFITGVVNNEDVWFVRVPKNGELSQGTLLVCYCSDSADNTYSGVITWKDALTGDVIDVENFSITQYKVGVSYDRTEADVRKLRQMRAETKANTANILKGSANRQDYLRIKQNGDLCFNLIYLNDSFPTLTVDEFPSMTYFSTLARKVAYVALYGYVDNMQRFLPGGENSYISDISYYDFDILAELFNRYQTWNEMEQTLFECWDICTTRFEYFGGSDIMPISILDFLTDVDDWENLIKLYIRYDDGDRSTRLSNLARTPIINNTWNGKSVIGMLNSLYAKCLEDDE